MTKTRYEVMRIDWNDPFYNDIDTTETSTGEVYPDEQVAIRRTEQLNRELSQGYDVGDGGVTTPQFYTRQIGSLVVDQYEN